MADWIQELKPGDKVVWHRENKAGLVSETIEKVLRVTEDTVVLSPYQRFDRYAGVSVVDNSGRPNCLCELTPEWHAEMAQKTKLNQLARLIETIDWCDLTPDQRRRIVAIIEE